MDEDVPERLIAPLEQRGHAATSVGRTRRKGISDALQLLFAAETDRVVVTHNARDHRLLQEAWAAWARARGVVSAARHNGILIIYSSQGLAATAFADAIDQLITIEGNLYNRFFEWRLTSDWIKVH